MNDIEIFYGNLGKTNYHIGLKQHHIVRILPTYKTHNRICVTDVREKYADYFGLPRQKFPAMLLRVCYQQCLYIYTKHSVCARSVSCSLGAGRTARVVRLAFGNDVLNLLPLAIQLLLLVFWSGSPSLATVRHLHSVLKCRSA